MALTAEEKSDALFSMTKEADKIAKYVRTIIDAINDLGAGTTIGDRIDASGAGTYEQYCGQEYAAVLDGWLGGQNQVKVYAYRMLKEWVRTHYAYAKAALADLGEDSYHGKLIENLLSYYGQRVPQYFYETMGQSQGKERLLGVNVVFAEDGRVNNYNRLGTLTATAGPTLTVSNEETCPSVATPNRIQWVCTTNVTGGDLVFDVASAYNLSSTSTASASAITGITIANGTTAGQTGHIVAAGTGAQSIEDAAGSSITLLNNETCAANLELTTQIQLGEETALALDFILSGTTAGAGDTLDLTGKDAYGAQQTESIDVSAGDGTYTSANTYSSINENGIDCTGWADGKLDVTQPSRKNVHLVLGATETSKFHVSLTNNHKALIIGTDSDSGETVSVVANVTGILADGITMSVSPIRLNIDTAYSIWPMYHQLAGISAGGANAATAGVVDLYPLGDRVLVW